MPLPGYWGPCLTQPVLQRERSPVARGGQPAAEACPAAESRQQGGVGLAAGGSLHSGARSDYPLCPTAHSVPDLAGAVKPDPGGEEKDVRHWGCLYPLLRPWALPVLYLLHPGEQLTPTPSSQPPDVERQQLGTLGAQVWPAVLPGACAWPRPVLGKHWAGPDTRPPQVPAPTGREGCVLNAPGLPQAHLCLQAPSPAYSSSSLYAPDVVTTSGPIISDITELAPTSPLASPGRSIDER